MGKDNRVTQSEKHLMKELFKQGKSVVQIAIQMDRNEITVRRHLKDEITASLKEKHNAMIGQKFGKLTVIEFDHTENHRKYWKCKCDCGNIKIARQEHLKEGKVKSCGCIRRGRPQTIAKVKVAPVKAKKQDNPRGRGHFGLFTQDIVLKGDYTEEKNKLYGEVKEYKMSKEELAEYLSKMSTREVTRRK